MKHQAYETDLNSLNKSNVKVVRKKHAFLFLNWQVQDVLFFLVCDNKIRQDVVRQYGNRPSSYFNFNKRKLYLLFEIVKYWVLNREFAKLIELVHVFICIIWLCQLGRSRLLLWIIWFFCIFCFNQQRK